MKFAAVAFALTALTATSALAQSSPSTQDTRQQERVDAILGALFGARTGGSTLDGQWAMGRFPLAQQRIQYEARIDADMRSGVLSQRAGQRAKADYRALVELEARYGADRRFSPQERADLDARYGTLSDVLDAGGEAGGVSGGASVVDGRDEFEDRVDDAVRSRQITRVQGTQLKADYAAAIRLEADYMRDGVLSVRERDDLEKRLDTLDARLGDTVSGPVRWDDPAGRLEAISRALPSSGVSQAAQAQLRIEYEDLSRLAAAYKRLNVSADDQSYLNRRLGELEDRAGVRRGRGRR